MCDSFDMACRDASNALHLNIKVNSENLLPNSQKYNVGSLRVPADPSWPKIPQRKLPDDLDDVIEPPCVVTLTGTSRKSRTTVRSSANHRSLSRPNNAKEQAPAGLPQSIYQKIPPLGQSPIKRRPGCADPRFKKVTTVKSQMTSTNSPDRERENPTESSRSAVVIANQAECNAENVRKTVPEKDTDTPKVTQQEAEKPGEIREIGGTEVRTTMTSNDHDSTLSERMKIASSGENEKFAKIEIADAMRKLCSLEHCSEITSDRAGNSPATRKIGENHEDSEKREIAKEKNLPSNETTVSKNNTASVGQPETPCYQCCQANNNSTGQLFLVVDSQAPAPSFGPVKIDGSPSQQTYTTQCYNVQLPVLSYQNLPLQIATQHPHASRIDVSSQLSLTPVLTIPSTPSINSSIHHHHHHHLDIARGTISRISEVPESFVKEPTIEKTHPSNDRKTRDTDGITEGRGKDESSPEDAERRASRRMLDTPPSKTAENCRDSRCCRHVLSDTTDSEMCGNFPSKPSRGPRIPAGSKETSISGSDYDVGPGGVKVVSRDRGVVKKTRGNLVGEVALSRNRECPMDRREMRMLESTARTISDRRRLKSEEHLPRSYEDENYKNVSEPRINAREMRRGIRDAGDFCAEMTERREDNESDDVDSENIGDCCDTHRTDLSMETAGKTKNISSTVRPNETTCLPVETQRLLSKSYMEYYDKLRTKNCREIAEDEDQQQRRERYERQMEMGAPRSKKRRAETITDMMKMIEARKKEKAEITTMEKLSALSNIINRNLNSSLRNISDQMQTKQLYVNENMKSLSDQITASTTQQSPVINPTADSPLAPRQTIKDHSPDGIYDSSAVESETRIVTNAKRKQREKHQPAERRLLKLKTIAFFGFMMYAMIVLLPMMYAYLTYDDYEDYEDLSYVELTIDYVVSSFREAFGGLFDAIDDIFFRPVSLD